MLEDAFFFDIRRLHGHFNSKNLRDITNSTDKIQKEMEYKLLKPHAAIIICAPKLEEFKAAIENDIDGYLPINRLGWWNLLFRDLLHFFLLQTSIIDWSSVNCLIF